MMRDCRPYCVALLCFLKRLSVQENLKKTYESELEKYMIRVLPLGSGLRFPSSLYPWTLATRINARVQRERVQRERVMTRKVVGGGDGGREESLREKERGLLSHCVLNRMCSLWTVFFERERFALSFLPSCMLTLSGCMSCVNVSRSRSANLLAPLLA